MKFTKGYWLNREGVENHDAVQIREVRLEGNRLYLYVVDYNYDGRGMGGPILEMYVSSPRENIIRTEAFHFIGEAAKYPSFELEEESFPLTVEYPEDGTISVKSGMTELRIRKNPCEFTYYCNGKKLTSVGNRFGHSMISYMKTPDGPFMRVQLDLAIGEKVYGLGERFTPFVKNGQSVETWNEDGGTCTEISYKSLPFYITDMNYGVLVNDSGPVSYEIATEHVTRAQFSVPGEKIDFMVIGGNSMKEVLEHYTSLSGKPALPPAWSFGLWLTSSFTTSYDEKTVTGFISGMKERDIPLSVFHFDCYWMRENRWCDFTWDEEMFPDPRGMLSRLKAQGLKICVWINPYIAQRSSLFKEAAEKGYLIRKENGDVWQTDMWQAGMGIVDFTNPDAWAWYQSKLKGLLDDGVDCFKTDFGERIPTDCVYFDGSDPLRMHNYYSYLYNKCVFELLIRERGEGEACLFARSATVGGQKFPVHWGGDCNSTYPSMAESLRGGLSLCLSGFGFWSHDISGFEGTATADLYKRWAAFGLLSTHSRLHGSASYRVPWLFSKEGEVDGAESVAVVRKFSKLKNALMPYIYGAAVEAHEKGIPAMRAMVLEFPGDISCEDLDRQYMLGDSILVAPVFTKEGDVTFYLPDGRWTSLLTGKCAEKTGWVKETHDFFSLPLYVRENSIIPVGACDGRPDYDYTDGLTVHVFKLTGKAERTIYTTDGKKAGVIYAELKDGDVKVTADGEIKNYRVVVH